ncbi:hypothetical protein RirG_197500 [Rhizophagus irregularis DAOM 197198w]|uniref:Uncharacterized protein n=1 Tax=Rhizophagus irregularis (strain DAOM 197198w) TaxID=1432141 RepID=A0A015IMQ2_RHIIW|nr:hypothetical protein RirG_197500 [Rhizophagus irregularis DAOM 197198w]
MDELEKINVEETALNIEETVHDVINVVPHDGKPITKMAISPKSKYIVTYSQEDKSFVCWSQELEGPIYDKHASPECYFQSYMDFKVSDKMIIILNKEFIYDMKNEKKVILNNNEPYDVKHDFLSNGDIITYYNHGISIYSSSDNRNWKCKSEHKLNEKNKIFGRVVNDKLLVLMDNIIFIIDLFELSIIPYWKVLIGTYTFQYWKILPHEKEINIEEIKLNFSKNLTVININGTLYIYSNKMNEMNVSIGDIDDNSVQDFGIVDNYSDEYIITTSNGNINIHSWRQNLKKSIDLNSLLKSKDDFTHLEFMDNKVFLYLYRNKRWITKEYDWKYFKTLLLDINSSNLKGVINNKNIFCNIEKQFITQKLTQEVNENQFIENYIIPSLKTCGIFQKIEEQNEYNLRLKSNDKREEEIILETVLSSNEKKEIVISSYNTKLKFKDWEHKEVNNNILIFYKKEELRIYIFDMKFKKIQLLECINTKFLEYAIKYYKKSTLDDSDFDKISEHTENNYLKRQWIESLLKQKYFLVHYGIKLLKSAIEKNNVELIDAIIDKIWEYFKKNPNRNIYLLSIIIY